MLLPEMSILLLISLIVAVSCFGKQIAPKSVSLIEQNHGALSKVLKSVKLPGSVVSKLTFAWAKSVMHLGNMRPLEVSV